MIRPLSKLILPFSILAMGSVPAAAQTFIAPTAYSFIYGSSLAGQRPEMTACYSKSDVNTTQFGLADIYLGSWSPNNPGAPASEVTYYMAVPGSPTAMLAQGSILYTNVADLEVGMIYDQNYNEMVVLVAYYEFGVGHKLDTYRMTGPASNPFVKVSTINLSVTPKYGRIRMDCHLEYAAAIVWENPAVGIEAIACNSGNWGGTIQLNGTTDESAPDVAFSHAADLNIRFVYKNRGNGIITESVIDWQQLISFPFATLNIVVPNIEDQNPAPMNISNMVIDCPDHYGVENWAYTYTDGGNVYVRFIDHNSGTPPTTVIVNSGLWGPSGNLTTGFFARKPTIHYGDAAQGGASGNILLAWYSPYVGGDSHYLALEANENFSVRVSPADYLRLPNTVSYTYPYSGVAFSKMSDLAPAYLYTTFITEAVPSSGNYHLRHAFHPYSNTMSFKGAKNNNNTAIDACRKRYGQLPVRSIKTSAYPNPFAHTFNNSFHLEENSEIVLHIADIKGTVVKQHTEHRPAGTHTIKMDNLDQLVSGTYFLTTYINGVKSNTQIIVKK